MTATSLTRNGTLPLVGWRDRIGWIETPRAAWRMRRAARAWEKRRQQERPVEQLLAEVELYLDHPEPTWLGELPPIDIPDHDEQPGGQ